jgi:methylglutaconyl-CoA hydratase
VQALLAGAPGAQRRIKALLSVWADSGWEEYRTGLPRTLAEVRSGDEARDGLAAFFEKRKPRWLQTP